MLYYISFFSLAFGIICFAIILIDILMGNRQKMMIMNFVYPITGLYAGPLALWVYYTLGRKSTEKAMKIFSGQRSEGPPKKKPFWKSVVIGTLHCGSGCTLADIIAETILLFFPFVLFGKALYGAWVVDYILALGIGIIFQYYAIVPMKNLSIKQGLVQAFKVDFFSLTSWQIGMYGWMAFATFIIFGRALKADEPVFWFTMQIAMLFGFLTAYPINWLLIKQGIKETM